ncbi:MAG: SpoVG family protein [Planctomycetaceae bacterium]|nr:SpoVG family protein [Planctomycetaceae bacterium]
MKITKIRLTMLPPGSMPVCAYATITFDDQLAIHDLRIIRKDERLFVAMPNRKRTRPCHKCQTPHTIPSRFCSNCGNSLRSGSEHTANSRTHVDIAHPLTAEFRAMIEREILDSYHSNLANGTDLSKAEVFDNV